MMRLLLLSCLILFYSCKKVEEESSKEYDLYQYSEMALYMHSIYDMHTQIREKILAGEELPELPSSLENIHTAEMSGLFERTESFEAFSRMYLQQVTFIYDTITDTSVKDRYNNAITACVACHQTTCLGPIPKIKKLLIN